MGTAWAAGSTTDHGTASSRDNSIARGDAGTMTHREDRADRRDNLRDAQSQVRDAAQVIRRMERDRGAASLLRNAKGVFVIPHYGRAALGIGGRGGEGVLMIKRNGQWTDVAFYNTGGASIGLEAGVEGGSLVYVLNDDKAVTAFRQDNKWSLNAEAGLTVFQWSGKAHANAGRGDVTVWSDTKGLLGAAAVSVTDIDFDEEDNAAFYGRRVRADDIFSQRASARPAQVAVLRDALASASNAGPKTYAR
jgi:lipid-binding SYLF domain-containing protein